MSLSFVSPETSIWKTCFYFSVPKGYRKKVEKRTNECVESRVSRSSSVIAFSCWVFRLTFPGIRIECRTLVKLAVQLEPHRVYPSFFFSSFSKKNIRNTILHIQCFVVFLVLGDYTATCSPVHFLEKFEWSLFVLFLDAVHDICWARFFSFFILDISSEQDSVGKKGSRICPLFE
jgi:hypothetical protein